MYINTRYCTSRTNVDDLFLSAGAAADESQRVKLAAVNIRPSTQANDSSTEPPATLRDLEQKLRRKVGGAGL